MVSKPEAIAAGEADGWVLVVYDDQFSEARSPQYNEDNLSQPQLAGASTGNTDQDAMSVEQEDDHSALDHRTVSNAASTETASTETMTGLRSDISVTSSTASPSPSGQALTESTLLRHQRELSQTYVGHVGGWVQGTGLFNRFGNEFNSSMQNSMVYRIGQSGASTVSSMFLDLEPAVVVRSVSFDTLQIGAWSERVQPS